MHDDQIQDFPLGDTWESNPLVWRNFVWWVIRTRGLDSSSHYVILDCVKLELANWNLTFSERLVQGTQDDLTAWQLAYG
jgi:hypothetical protein